MIPLLIVDRFDSSFDLIYSELSVAGLVPGFDFFLHNEYESIAKHVMENTPQCLIVRFPSKEEEIALTFMEEMKIKNPAVKRITNSELCPTEQSCEDHFFFCDVHDVCRHILFIARKLRTQLVVRR